MPILSDNKVVPVSPRAYSYKQNASRNFPVGDFSIKQQKVKFSSNIPSTFDFEDATMDSSHLLEEGSECLEA